MNYCICYVTKIRSYQTLMVKTGRFTYPSKHYKPYKAEMYEGMQHLKPMPKDVPIKIKLVFNVKQGVNERKWVVKMKETGNTSKLCDTKEEALEYYNPNRHYIEERPLVINYGSVPDVDNAMKGVVDSLEEFDIIDNDRNVIHIDIVNTFNNDRESIEITLEEMNINTQENGVVSFS